ncbi:unnamed protein product [Chondrus crispus]|uniref:Uncharacterized protein n=1 Tax=Chondrus crispus TaxID=2769 RepID=R7QHE5_CHOCR|nr:unnamed protein product [Chondrus crispus]CDF37183.1 unnamed protein product [Chondrus crispus]|eukprot:XP_005717002.1 unnamed protein product [Chondrus crispus]
MRATRIGRCAGKGAVGQRGRYERRGLKNGCDFARLAATGMYLRRYRSPF